MVVILGKVHCRVAESLRCPLLMSFISGYLLQGKKEIMGTCYVYQEMSIPD